jgi:hypothetical protein
MAITKSTRHNAIKPVERPDKEAEIKSFYTEPIREEFEELVKPAKKKRVKNPNKTEFLMSVDNELLARIDADAKSRGIKRVAWMVRAAKLYLGDEDY